MPNTNAYHIYVHADTGLSKSPVAGANNAGQMTYGEKSSASLEKGVKSLVSFGAIKNTATSLIGHEVGMVELKTGAREYAQKQQFIFDRVNEGINAGASLVIGAATGNLPLAIISLVTSAANKLMNIMFNIDRLQTEQRLEDTAIRMQNIRAGIGGRRNM